MSAKLPKDLQLINHRIHKVLSGTSMDELVKLIKKDFKISTIKDTFIQYPERVYTPQAYNFIKNIVLEVDEELDKSKYINKTSHSGF